MMSYFNAQLINAGYSSYLRPSLLTIVTLLATITTGEHPKSMPSIACLLSITMMASGMDLRNCRRTSVMGVAIYD